MVQKIPIIKVCGSCSRVVAPRDAEMCWFCGDDLCIGCWDLKGHCGHAAADAINQAAARGPVLQEEMDRIMAEHGSELCPHHGELTTAARKRLTA